MAPRAAPARDAVGILGTGSCLPGKVVTNDEVGTPAGVTDEWISRKTAIHERRWATSDEATSDLAATAARAALTDAGIRPAEVSLVLVATSTPDSPSHPPPPRSPPNWAFPRAPRRSTSTRSAAASSSRWPRRSA